MNAINDSLVLLDRKNYGSALIAGVKCSGKTFALKREVANTLASTREEVVVLARDPGEYRRFADDLGGCIYPDLCVDVFHKGDNYNLDGEKEGFQELFLEAYLAMKLGTHRDMAVPEEREAYYGQVKKEAGLLCGFVSMEEAVLYAKDHPREVPLFIQSLDFAERSLDRFSPKGRLSVLGYGTDAELAGRLDLLWDHAVEAKKKNRTVWIFVNAVDPFLYPVPGSAYLVSLLEKAEKLGIPVTMVLQDAVQAVTDEEAAAAKGRMGSVSTNKQETGRELMSRIQVEQMDNTQCLVFIRGLRPFKVKNTGWRDTPTTVTWRKRIKGTCWKIRLCWIMMTRRWRRCG